MTTPNSQKIETVEDCRDYLRTGRCKYGASCKFNHPPNVQSGGGMKAPLDPSEPPFPIRPNQPVCQYYMKHGSCKFGQACKFHHPPLSTVTTYVNGNTVLMRNNDAIPQQILLNTVGNEQPSTMMVQLLPQRPDDPDCIYFLRNGRCKYGATCRYHHPINHRSERKQVEVSRSIVQLPTHLPGDGNVLSNQILDGSVHCQPIQFVQQSTFSTQSTRVVNGPNGPTHLLVTETPIAVMPVANGGNHISGTYHSQILPVSNNVQGNNDYRSSVGGTIVPVGIPEERTSSSSSIASSFETGSANLEYLPSSLNDWNRTPKRNGSGNNLNGFVEQPRGMNGSRGASHTIADGVGTRRHRATSFGSIGEMTENSAYNDGVVGWSQHDPRYESAMFDHSQSRRRVSISQFNSIGRTSEGHFEAPAGYRDELATRQNARHIPPTPPVTNRAMPGDVERRQGAPDVDQGLSMMTSALLNMLDTTPEEAGARTYPSRISSSSTFDNGTSPPVTPRRAGPLTTQEPPLLNEHMMPLPNHPHAYRLDLKTGNNHTHQMGNFQGQIPRMGDHHVQYEGIPQGQETLYMSDGDLQRNMAHHHQDNSRFSPTWHRNASIGRGLETRNPHLLPALHSRHIDSNSPQVSSNVGLFLS